MSPEVKAAMQGYLRQPLIFFQQHIKESETLRAYPHFASVKMKKQQYVVFSFHFENQIKYLLTTKSLSSSTLP